MVIIQNGALPPLSTLTGGSNAKAKAKPKPAGLTTQDMHLTDGYYEIIGSVKDDKSVKALTSIELGPSLGMSFSPLLVMRLTDRYGGCECRCGIIEFSKRTRGVQLVSSPCLTGPAKRREDRDGDIYHVRSGARGGGH